MSNHQFIESIRCEDGNYSLLDFHQERVDRTFHQFFKNSKPLELSQILPRIELMGTFKVRVVYSRADTDVEYISYQKRKIRSLELVEANEMDYSFKYEDRTEINRLFKAAKADDVIMIKKGLITDSSYSNLAFWNGKDWLTPQKPLLHGVKRAHLLAEEKIKEAPISINDLGAFEKVSLINAMLDLGEVEISTTKILESKTES